MTTWENDDNGVDPEWQEIGQSGTVVMGGTKIEQLANVSVPSGEAPNLSTIIYSTETKLWTPVPFESVGEVVSVFGRAGVVVAVNGDYVMGQLGDVELAGLSDGDLLAWNATAGDWLPVAQPAGSVISVFGRQGVVEAVEGDYDLGELGDVSTTGVTTNDALIFNGASWVPSPAVLDMNGLSDVNTTGVQPNQHLAWNSVAGEWQPVNPVVGGATSLDGLSDVTIGGVPVTLGQVLVNNGAGQFINEILLAAQVKNTPAGTIAASDVQAAINELDTEKATKFNPDEVYAEPITTGVVSGGLLSGVSTTQFQISAGTGVIMDTYTDYQNPVSTEVSWNTQTVNLLNPTTEQQTYVRMDANGDPVLTNIPPEATQTRTSIVLGSLFHDPLNVDPPVPFNRYAKIGTTGHMIYDYIQYSPVQTEGLGLEPTTLLQAKQFAGSAFFPNINEQVDITNPHVLAIAETDPYTFYYMLGDGVINPAALQNTFDPTQYDPGGLGVLTPVSTAGAGVRATIQYAYAVAPGVRVVLYGQTEYADIATAEAALLVDKSNLVVPPELQEAIGPVYAVIMRQGATDLNLTADALIISFLEGGGGGGGGGGTTLVSSVFGRQGAVEAVDGDYDLDELGDVILTNPADTEVLTFNGTNWVNAPGGGGGGGAQVTISESPPGSPSAGDLWWDNTNTDAVLYIYYTDADSSQWVPTYVPGGSAGSSSQNPDLNTPGAGVETNPELGQNPVTQGDDPGLATQNTINFNLMLNNPDGTFRFGAGVFYFAEGILSPFGATVLGQGQGATIFKSTAAGANHAWTNSGFDGADFKNPLVVRDLELLGTGVQNAGFAGIYSVAPVDASFAKISGFDIGIIGTDVSTAESMAQCVLYSVEIVGNASHGMHILQSGTSAPRNISLIECRISQNGGDGLRVEGTGTADIRTYGGKFGKNGGIGLNVIEADAVQASKINSTGNTGGDISIGSAVAGSKFDVSTLTVDVATNVILPTPNTNKNVFTYKGEDYMDVKDYGGGSAGGGDVTINTYTANHTLTSADASAYVDMDLATDGTLTVPPNSSEPFSVGNQTTVRAHGLGKITIVEGAGVTIYTPDTLVLRKQFSSVTLVKRGTDEWDLMGDVELFA